MCTVEDNDPDSGMYDTNSGQCKRSNHPRGSFVRLCKWDAREILVIVRRHEYSSTDDCLDLSQPWPWSIVISFLDTLLLCTPTWRLRRRVHTLNSIPSPSPLRLESSLCTATNKKATLTPSPPFLVQPCTDSANLHLTEILASNLL